MALADAQLTVGDPPPPPGTVPEMQAQDSTPDPPPPPDTVPEGPTPTPTKTLLTGTPGSLETAHRIYGGGPAPVPEPADPPPPPNTVPEPQTATGALSAAGGSLQAGIEGVKQIGPAVGLSAAQRQLDTMDRIDRGETVNPNDDPLGYANLSPEQRAKARTDLVTSQATNVGTLAGSVLKQQAVPTDPGVKAFQQAHGWGQTLSALGDAPVAVLQDSVLRGLPSLIPMLAATMAGGPGAGIATGIIGSGPSAFAGNLIQTMQAQGVDVNDPDQRAAWVTKNGDTIKSLYDRAMNVAAASTVAQVGPFEAAHVLPIPSLPARVATGAGIGAASGAAAPVIEGQITGEPVSPQSVLTGGATGAVFGASGGAGGRPEERPVAQPPRSVEEQRLPPAGEAPPAAEAAPVAPVPPACARDTPGRRGSPGGACARCTGHGCGARAAAPPGHRARASRGITQTSRSVGRSSNQRLVNPCRRSAWTTTDRRRST